MKPQIQTRMFYISAVLVLISTALFITKWTYAPYLFAVGAAGIAVYYFSNHYTGTNVRLKRLHRFNIFSGILLVVTSYLMFKNRSEWIATLSIAAFLQLYVSIITGIEEKKK